jgi:hypothetical protein
MKQVLFILLVFLSFNGFSQTKYKTVKIDSLEVMKADLGKMTWDDAYKACEKLGDGWRLPNPIEFDLLFKNRDIIGGFKSELYWSYLGGEGGFGWAFSFATGTAGGYTSNEDEDEYDGTFMGSPLYVRAVRDLK